MLGAAAGTWWTLGVLAVAGPAAAQPLPPGFELPAGFQLPPGFLLGALPVDVPLPAPPDPCPADAALPPPLCALAAQRRPAPDAPPARWRFEGALDVRFVDLAHLRLEGNVSASQVVLDGAEFGAADLRAAHAEGRKLGQGDALADAVEEAGRGMLGERLGQGNPVAVTLDREALREAGQDAPVRAHVASEAPLGAVPAGSEARARAAFRAGALVAFDLELAAPAGGNLTYTLHAPEGLVFAAASLGAVSHDGARLVVDAPDPGETDGVVTLRATLRDPAARAPASEEASARIDVALGAPTPRGLPVTLDLAARFASLDAARFPGALPEGVELPFLGADGLRALLAADALDAPDLAAAERTLVDGLRADLAAFLPGAVVSGGLSRADLAPDAAPGAPVRFDARASGWSALREGEAEDLDLALALGATVTLDVALPGASLREATYVLHPPPGTVLVGAPAEGLEVPAGPDGAVARLALRRADAPLLSEADARVHVRVDVRGVELDAGEPRMRVDVQAEALVRALALPDEARAALDPRVSLTHLDADGVRLLRARGALDDANLSAVEARLVEEARAALRDALGADVAVAGGFDAASLAADGQGPLGFSVRATLRQPLAAGASPQAALALYTQRQTFDLPRFAGMETAYEILLPEGFVVAGVESANGEVTPQRIGTREALLLVPGETGMRATATLVVTPAYLVAHHAPLLVALASALVLLLEVPVGWLLLRRGRRRALPAPSDEA